MNAETVRHLSTYIILYLFNCLEYNPVHIDLVVAFQSKYTEFPYQNFFSLLFILWNKTGTTYIIRWWFIKMNSLICLGSYIFKGSPGQFVLPEVRFISLRRLSVLYVLMLSSDMTGHINVVVRYWNTFFYFVNEWVYDFANSCCRNAAKIYQSLCNICVEDNHMWGGWNGW